MDDVTGSGLVAPPIAQVARAALAELGAAESLPRVGPVSRSEQARALDRIVECGGLEALLMAGQHLRTAPRHDPIVMVLLNSASIAIVLEKVERLNRYLHSHHRQRILARDEHSVEIEHYSERRLPPTPRESVFVAGLLAALLEAVGAQDLGLAFPAAGDPAPTMVGSVIVRPVPDRNTHRWLFSWAAFTARPSIAGLDDLLATGFGPDLSAPPTTRALRGLLASDPAQRWTLARAAAGLALSSRTLQRRLAAEATSYQAELTRVRVDGAAQALEDRGRSITEIGYSFGFSDTAHFSRTFKRHTGYTPSHWRNRA